MVFDQGFMKEIKGKVEQKAVSEERWFLVKGSWKKSRARLNKNSLRREVVFGQGFMEEVKGEIEQKQSQKRGGSCSRVHGRS